MSDTTWTRPLPGRSGYRNDAILAVVLAAGMTVSTMLYTVLAIYPEPAPAWVSGLCILVSTLPLIARRRYPSLVATVVAAAFIVTQMLSVPELLFGNIALFIALYSVGAWAASRRVAHLVRAGIVVVMFGWIAVALYWQATEPAAMEAMPGGAITSIVAFGTVQIITNALYFGGGWYFGDRAWAAARERVALQARTDELARERELTAVQAISLERVRIARELHDVVAHHVSVMGLQAGAARRVLETDPAKAAASLVAIETSARSAVDDMHRLLTTLRDDGTAARGAGSGAGSGSGGNGSGAAVGGRDPGPDATPSVTGIDQLDALARHTEGAGVAARFTVIGPPRPVPATVDATTYRIAQEAVTNTLKHAGPGASIDMRLRYLDESIEIEVTDDGGHGHARSHTGSVTSSTPTKPTTGGLGLVGMRERVAAVGGSLESGPRARGGYLVRASLPARVTS